MAEYKMFLKNKELQGIRYVTADDDRIFKFIEEIQALPRNNQIIEFRQADEIATHLREQWAGLFQRFLQQQEQFPDRRAADDLHEALKTVNQLVTFLTNERREQGGIVSEILLMNHPIFARIRKLTNTSFPVFFRDADELNSFLKAQRWSEYFDEFEDSSSDNCFQWTKKDAKQESYETLLVSHEVFEEDGKLKIHTNDEWDHNWVVSRTVEPYNTEVPDEEIPF